MQEEDQHWRDLPSELLFKISTSCGGIQNSLCMVCLDWKVALEASSTKLTIIGSRLQHNLPARFHLLRELDLRTCDPNVEPRNLRSLQVSFLSRQTMESRGCPSCMGWALKKNGATRTSTLACYGGQKFYLDTMYGSLSALACSFWSIRPFW